MAKVNWTFQALEDLSDIGEQLAQNSNSYASHIVKVILEKTELLQSFPELGRIVPESKIKSIRCLLYTSPSPRDATLSRMPSSA